ncbi:MAG: undecaprenyl/decaprenyl-phosphate alpha-N-acetylglucosaminyl 1-phosphate transferase [Actinomycetota bacterium]|nr:undecaprenyl/decaprenyl-phosphate alpha-N-acetylglucosaminyl 1-phosphate transferase [Actinomycetota bacterium]
MLHAFVPTVGVGVVAALVTLGTTPVVGRLARVLGMHDAPDDRKLHQSLVPYLGGMAILAGWIVAFLTPGTFAQSAVLLGSMTVLGIVGFVDDRYDISPHLRLGVQVAIACLAYAGGIRMTPTEITALDFLLTVLWLVGMTNAFNFMDNMDGLATGVGGIAALFLGLSGIIFGQQLVSVLGFGLAGACLGFLRHNFHPARIFMGDTGSLPLGFGLAALAIKVKFPGVHPLIAFAVPVVILGLFLIDTTVMALGRAARREPLIGGRLDHLSHRLLKKELPVRRVAVRMYGAAVALGCSALLMATLSLVFGLVSLGVVLIVSFWAGGVALRWPILRGLESTTRPESPQLAAARP